MTTMFKTGDLINRGWARAWIEPMLGEPIRGERNSKLWKAEAVIAAEAHPIFAEAAGILRDLMRHARYQTPEIEGEALALARKRLEGGPDPLPVNRPKLCDQPVSGHVWRVSVAGGIELRFQDGLAIAVPQPFLDGLQRALGVDAERFLMAIDLVLSDWNASKTMPQNPPHGRAFFLGGVRYQLNKLAALEAEALTVRPSAPIARSLH